MKYIGLALLAASVLVQAADLTVSVNGIKDTKGTIAIGLFNKRKGFLKDAQRYKGVRHRIHGHTVRYTFASLPAGTYAVSIYHDHNNNGALDRNFLGIPKEGYGVSNNPRVFGKPTFDQCKFPLKKNKNISIQVRY